ncbi:MAG: T9SS type A sorting domain-containing protein [Flavobacteriaceae bacterium]
MSISINLFKLEGLKVLGMKLKLLFFIAFFVVNLSLAETHVINWGVNTHGVTNIFVGDTVQWNFVGFHDVTSSGSPSFVSSAQQSGGSYSVTFNSVGDYNYFCSVHGAISMDGTIVVSLNLSVDDQAQPIFSIYPNPSSDVLNLKLPNNSSNAIVEIFDVTGKNVYKSKATKQTSVNVINWKTGLYFVQVSFDDYKVTKRFVKE